MTSLFQKVGSKFGTCVDSFMSKSGFTAISDELANIQQSLIPESAPSKTENFSAKKSSEKFTSCEKPENAMEALTCATSKFSAVDDSTSTAVAAATTEEEDQKQKMKELEAKTKDYIAKDASLAWAGGSNDRLRHVRWANQVVEAPTSKGPISYQDSILSQPLPVLSPLRGTNQPQGIRAIADADAGRSMSYYDPTKAIGVALPTNVSSSNSLDSSVKVNVAGKESTSNTTGTTSSFMAKFM